MAPGLHLRQERRFSPETSLPEEWQLWQGKRNPHPPCSLTSAFVFVSLLTTSTGGEGKGKKKKCRQQKLKLGDRLEVECQRIGIFHPACLKCGRILASVHNLRQCIQTFRLFNILYGLNELVP